MTNQSNSESCYNCGYFPLDGIDYCPQCGQRKQAQRLTLSELFQEAANALIGYDSQLWRTLGYVWVPGKLPEMYRSGQRKALLHPVRLFFFSFLVLVLVSQFTMTPLVSGLDGEGKLIKVHRSSSDTAVTEVLGKESLPNIVEGLDSLRVRDSVGLFYSKNGEMISGHAVSKKWINEMSPDQLMDTLNIHGLMHRMTVSQQLKFFESEKSFGNFLVGALVWMYLFLQPLLAFFLFIIMWKKTFYSDHLIWSVYTHASFFIFFILWLLIEFCIRNFLDPLVMVIIGQVFAITMIGYVSLSVKRYYSLKPWKWLMVMIYLALIYFVCFLLMFAINLVLSFFLF